MELLEAPVISLMCCFEDSVRWASPTSLFNEMSLSHKTFFKKIVILNTKHKFISYHFNFDCFWPALSLVVTVVNPDFESRAISIVPLV